MSSFKKDTERIQKLAGEAFTKTGALSAIASGAKQNPAKLQQTLEDTMFFFEEATLEMRYLCETHMPGVGGYGGRRKTVPEEPVAGSVERLGGGWLHITLHTLLPHCRYQPPAWLSDTIQRLLDDYETQGGVLPHFQSALLILDEHSCISGRKVYDQDNKGWKAVSNALKGRVIPDDDQYTLSVVLLSSISAENVTHIVLMDPADAGDFFSLRSRSFVPGNVYQEIWSY